MDDEDIKQVEINGETFAVPAKLAGALERQNEDVRKFQVKVSSLEEKINNMKVVQPAEPSEIDMDDDDIFTNPNGYLSKREKKLREEVKAEVREELRREQDQKAKADQFWSKFYGANQDLKEYQDFVNFILQRDYNELGSMQESKALSELAERVRQYILKIKPPSAKTEEIVLEDASSPFAFQPGQAKSKQDEEDTSLGALVKKRRQAHKAAN